MSGRPSSTMVLVLIGLVGSAGGSQLFHGQSPGSASSQLRVVPPSESSDSSPVQASFRGANGVQSPGQQIRLLPGTEVDLTGATGRVVRYVAKPVAPVADSRTPQPFPSNRHRRVDRMLGRMRPPTGQAPPTAKPNTPPVSPASPATLAAKKPAPSQQPATQSRNASTSPRYASQRELLSSTRFQRPLSASPRVAPPAGTQPKAAPSGATELKIVTDQPSAAPAKNTAAETAMGKQVAQAFRNKLKKPAAERSASDGSTVTVVATDAGVGPTNRSTIDGAFPRLNALGSRYGNTPLAKKPTYRQPPAARPRISLPPTVANRRAGDTRYGSTPAASPSVATTPTTPPRQQKLSLLPKPAKVAQQTAAPTANSPRPQPPAERPLGPQVAAATGGATEPANRPVRLALGGDSSPRAAQAFTPPSSLESVEATVVTDGPAPVFTPYPERAKIVFRPAVLDVKQNGQPVFRPDVRLAQQQSIVGGAGGEYLAETLEEVPPGQEVVVPEEWSAPVVSGPYEHYVETCQPAAKPGPIRALVGQTLARLRGPCCNPRPGLGVERVPHAISFVETSQPLNNFSFYVDSAYDWEFPDRSEFFWARIGGRGPAQNETSVDYQDLRFALEVGGEKFSVTTDIPIRIVEPEINEGDAGLGDISIGTKTVFYDSCGWQLTNLFKVFIPSGDSSGGLGTGHASIEPGFAWRYKYSDVTYLHGDVKYWVPLGADAEFGGEVLTYGAAISHVWYETDSFAVLPTLEFVGLTFLDGAATAPNGATIDVDSDGVFNIHPGIRWAWDHRCSGAVREFGVFGGFNASSNSLYEEIVRFEFRWSF